MLPEGKTRKLKDLYIIDLYISNHNCRIGKQDSCDLAKMDANTQLFILHDRTIYDSHGSKMFCCKTGASGLEKPQETSQTYPVVILHVLNL